MVLLRPSVCLCSTYLIKYLTNQLHFWWESLLWFEEMIRFWKKSPRGKGGGAGVGREGGAKWPNDKEEKNFPVAITPNRWEIDMWLLLDTNRKSYGESNCTFRFYPEWPWKVKLKVTKISKPYISEKSLVKSYITNLTLIGNHIWGSPMALSLLTLSSLERSNSRSLIFWSLRSHKRA